VMQAGHHAQGAQRAKRRLGWRRPDGRMKI